MKAGKSFRNSFWQPEVQNSLTIERRIHLPEDYAAHSELPMVRQHLMPDGEVTDVLFLNHNGKYLGVLAMELIILQQLLRPHPRCDDCSFISIWVMVILGAVFNALTITKPIKELLDGVRMKYCSWKFQAANQPTAREATKDLISALMKWQSDLEL